MDEKSNVRAGWLVGLALLLVGFNLRPAIVAISPLLPEIRRTTGLSSALGGLLTTLPLVCFGGFAFLTPRLVRRFARERLLLVALLLLIAGIVIRLLPWTVMLFVGTTVAGGAIAVANVLLPGLIKRDFPDRIAQMTGWYAASLSGGAAIAAGATVPLREATGLGWRAALALWAVPVIAATAVMIPLATSSRVRRERADDISGPWRRRDPIVGIVTAYMGLQSLEFYAVLGWMPSIFQSHGMSPTASGWLVSFTSVIAVPSSLLTARWGRDPRRDRQLVVVAAAASAVGVGGLALDPRPLALVWTVLVGIGQGGAFALALSFIAKRASTAALVERLSTTAQGGGYLLASLGPITVGAIHQLSGGWVAPLVVLLALLVPELAAGLAAGRGRYIGGASSTVAQGAVVVSTTGRSAED